ncbi:hypothetical protein [Vibrio breoganii]|uniref:hypothetical protein n=1 Tax=Vibrio breoganii TaxID=553239 RepID=UPI000C83F22C|nr:hypothetical protein [Vibrio breoganii]PMM20303.1 hypothetical protein BCT59_07695 [Vibrio breoganii]
MQKYPFPLEGEGLRFKQSRHEDNLWQFLVAYTPDEGSDVLNRRAVKRNHRRWNLPSIGKYSQNVAGYAFDEFSALVGTGSAMTGATFYELGDGVDLNPTITLPTFPSIVPVANQQGLSDQEFLEWREGNVEGPAPEKV